MGYFAHIDENNIVTTVIVADQEFINTGAEGDPASWIETSIDGSFRKQYAGIGYTYDAQADVFILLNLTRLGYWMPITIG
jgi:hypothetical protein